jgi:glycosyltransferase involved in cell wall biosynthesis
MIDATGGGLLHTAGDEGDLVAALERLADDQGARKSMGQQGASAVRERFSASLMAARTRDLLGGLVG